jgi:hypothetical protein
MSKKDFIKKLEDELTQRDVNQESVDEIIEDYNDIIDGALDKGEDEVSVLERIGRPFDIARTLSKVEQKVPKGNNSSKSKGSSHKLVALSPFIATIIFFVVGYQFDLWHLSWMAFLLIPITAILSEMRHDFPDSLVGLTVFVALIAFFILGFNYGLWHPGWIVFLAIPIMGILTEARKDVLGSIVGLTTFAVLIFYFLYGYYYGIYHPTWVVFFLIPLMTVFDRKKTFDKFVTILLFLIIPLFYLYLEYIEFSEYNYLIFALSILIGLSQGYIQVGFKFDDLSTKEGLTVVAIIIAYIVLGIGFNLWHPGWLIFLLIPVAMMFYSNSNIPFVAYSPFVATATFILLGHYFDLYHIAWLVFLIIPMAGILSDN